MCDNTPVAATADEAAAPACWVIGSFPMGDRTCEVLAFHQPGERTLGRYGILARGLECGTSMSKPDARYFWDHRAGIPPEYQNYIFMFPQPDATYYGHGHGDGTSVESVSWFLGHWHPTIEERLEVGWDTNCVLVRFVPPLR